MKCKLCEREIPEEDIVPEMQHQICYECEVNLEYGWFENSQMWKLSSSHRNDDSWTSDVMSKMLSKAPK